MGCASYLREKGVDIWENMIIPKINHVMRRMHNESRCKSQTHTLTPLEKFTFCIGTTTLFPTYFNKCFVTDNYLCCALTHTYVLIKGELCYISSGFSMVWASSLIFKSKRGPLVV
jgi:hypothetical protein